MQNPFKGSGSIDAALHLLHSITRHAPSLNTPESATPSTAAERGQPMTAESVAAGSARVHHLTSQIEALEEENRALRKSAHAFGDLAERLSEQLRMESAHRARLIMSRPGLRTHHSAPVPGQHFL
jgi:outer membrane murein-binding lipoprotein Lpp